MIECEETGGTRGIPVIDSLSARSMQRAQCIGGHSFTSQPREPFSSYAPEACTVIQTRSVIHLVIGRVPRNSDVSAAPSANEQGVPTFLISSACPAQCQMSDRPSAGSSTQVQAQHNEALPGKRFERLAKAYRFMEGERCCSTR